MYSQEYKECPYFLYSYSGVNKINKHVYERNRQNKSEKKTIEKFLKHLQQEMVKSKIYSRLDITWQGLVSRSLEYLININKYQKQNERNNYRLS